MSGMTHDTDFFERESERARDERINDENTFSPFRREPGPLRVAVIDAEEQEVLPALR